MDKKILFMAVMGLALVAVAAPTIRAQENVGMEISPTTLLPITRAYESTDGSLIFKSYEVDATRAGKYYSEFWLLPAKYSDGNYTTFTVYVNGEAVGKITPKAGNWQSARIEGMETIELREGKNVISIATTAPEIPAVETLRVASTDLDACISSEAYEEYLEDAKACLSFDINKVKEETQRNSNLANADLGISLPLYYTFYNIFSFTEGEDVIFDSTGAEAHDIDILYYGSNPLINPGGPIIGPTDPIGPYNVKDAETAKAAIVAPYTKTELNYVHPTSAEMQGYGWLAHSEKRLDSSAQEARTIITIPKTGRYLVRLHTQSMGKSGVVTVNVKTSSDSEVGKTYEYEDVPITNIYFPFPYGSKSEYMVMTKCNTPGTDDPYLFIHGGDCNRVVGFNDDATSDVIEQYGLSKWDSCVSMVYDIKTSGFSVCNYNSSRPVSSCRIIYGVKNNNIQSQPKAKTSFTAKKAKTALTGDSIMISCDEELSGSLSIVADSEISNIAVFDIVGKNLCEIKGAGCSMNTPISSLNISQPGIYVVRVETVNSVLSQKIVVK